MQTPAFIGLKHDGLSRSGICGALLKMDKNYENYDWLASINN
jgi:hypothetical protein